MGEVKGAGGSWERGDGEEEDCHAAIQGKKTGKVLLALPSLIDQSACSRLRQVALTQVCGQLSKMRRVLLWFCCWTCYTIRAKSVNTNTLRRKLEPMLGPSLPPIVHSVSLLMFIVSTSLYTILI